MIVPYQKYYRYGPGVLRPDDALVLKVCAVRGWDSDWAAYQGLSEWSDERVLESGDKLSEEAATALFPSFAASGLAYRS